MIKTNGCQLNIVKYNVQTFGQVFNILNILLHIVTLMAQINSQIIQSTDFFHATVEKPASS